MMYILGDSSTEEGLATPMTGLRVEFSLTLQNDI